MLVEGVDHEVDDDVGGLVVEEVAEIGQQSGLGVVADRFGRRRGVEAGGVLVLGALGDDLGPASRPAIQALVAADRDGAPLGSVLQTLATEARTARRLALEASARALPVRLVFPLVACSLPAVLVGAVLPLLAVVAGRTGWP